MQKFLGIDTSCYTTSFAVVSSAGELIEDQRQLLEVPAGTGGLRQGDGVFRHVQNVTALVRKTFAQGYVDAIGVSKSPRPVVKSYMPVFTVGVAVAETLAAYNSIPLFYTSHQEGHLAAGLWSSGFQPKSAFLAVHISGGTSEILLVEPIKSGFEIKILGGTADLHAGQLVDRVGVAAGLKFPCGKEMERLALSLDYQPELRLHGHVTAGNFNFSGPETEAKRLLAQGIPIPEVAFAVFRVIANSLEKALLYAIAETGLKEILFVGGVAANTFIKERLMIRLSHSGLGAKLYFAKPDYSTDNAVGVAMLTQKIFLDRNLVLD